MWLKISVNILLLICLNLKTINAEVFCAKECLEMMNGEFGQNYDLQVNRSHVYIINYRNNTSPYPARLTVSSPGAKANFPLLIVAQQQKAVTSWQLPMVTDKDGLSTDYKYSSHTLCPPTLKLYQNFSTKAIIQKQLAPSECANPTVVIKTLSEENVTFDVVLELETDFFLKANKDYTKDVTASQPVYYYYNFNDWENMANDSDAVLVSAKSESKTCMLFSIQNSSCPILDLENNVKYDSYYQTMSQQAALVVLKRHYPDGFFVVMVVKQRDEECHSVNEDYLILGRQKTVTFRITPTITYQEHNLRAYITLMSFVVVLIVAMIVGIIYFIRTVRKAREVQESSDATEGILDNSQQIRWTQICFLSCKKDNRNASNYVWLVTIIILFYILPVLQVVITYQGIVNETGNDDLCYYNYLCSLPHKFIIHITDFNHVLSNIGYIFLGIVFILLTHLTSLRNCTRKKEGFGLMKPYGMFYALGISLIMEGVMSACYHICPKKSNFQFDTSFMYVMTVLMIVNVYEIRKGDATERKRDERGYVVFLTLAGVTAISVIGSYLGTKTSFWVVVTLLHVAACVIITWAVEDLYIKSIFNKAERTVMNYVDIVHGVLLVLINLANIGLAVFGMVMKNSFATHVLTVLIANGVMYTIFYIIMKIMYKERILIKTTILTVFAVICWIPAMYFFLSNVTSWEETPAESRNRNKECMISSYYDTHDIWHFLSAFALFFTCWVLLTLDEGLERIPTHDIVDFHNFTAVTRALNVTQQEPTVNGIANENETADEGTDRRERTEPVSLD